MLQICKTDTETMTPDNTMKLNSIEEALADLKKWQSGDSSR